VAAVNVSTDSDAPTPDSPFKVLARLRNKNDSKE
jgi:hypothetical protein